MTDARRFSGGRILTPGRSAESLLVSGGRVVAAGTESAVRAASPVGTEVVPLEGRLVVPGLTDAHLHLAELTRAREGLDVSIARSIDELSRSVAAWASRHPIGPIVGRGWSTEALGGRRGPTERDLAPSGVDRPVVLYHASGHAAVLNRPALLAVGFTDRTVDPPGGRLGRAADGTLDGMVYESALVPVDRFTREASPPDPGGIGRSLEFLLSLGVTTVGSMSTSPEEFVAVRTAVTSREATVRVRCFARASEWDRFGPADWATEGTEDAVALVGVKTYADGAFGPRTAWLSAPYADAPGESGIPVLGREHLDAFLERCRTDGRRPAVHAIGDRALVEVLRALERSAGGFPGPARVEHVSLVPPAVLSLLDQVQPTLVVQPRFLWTDSWLGERLGPARARWAYPFRTLLEQGHRLVGSSDAPFDVPDPWSGMFAAVHRASPGGGSANPTEEEALSAPQALDLYTRHAGVALGESALGSLEPGARADFVVTNARGLEEMLEAGSGAVRSTWAGGVCVYDRERPGNPKP